jgi:DNA-binding NarL/FixJ family response regulator
MPVEDKSQKTIIGQTRFLVLDPDTKIGERLKRFLLAEGAPAVHLAPSSILALRVLQDRRTPVDCVVCTHRPPAISGVEFLANLRAGRWGGLALQHLKVILFMAGRDAAVTDLADRLRVNGYIFGDMDREAVRTAIFMALDPQGRQKAPANFKLAHMRTSEADILVAAFPPSFGRLPWEKQQRALQAVAIGAKAEGLSGGVAAVFATENGGTSFIAVPAYERFMSRLSVAAVEKQLNRAIHVDWPDGDPTVADAPPAQSAADDAPAAPLPLFDEEEEAALDDRRRLAPKIEKSFARGLTEEDIRAVATAFKEMGAAEFVQKFVRNQAISLQGQSQPLTPMMREYYVSIELLRNAFFPGIEMRGSNRAFQSLTHLLDQLMLRSLPFLPQNRLPTSLNLNVHSILTKTFESSLKGARGDLLTFEIPQPMIVSHFEEFKKARELITAYGGKIAVDQIFPDTIGHLDLDQVGASIAKLHWKGGLKNFSQAHRDFVKRAIDRGVTIVMSRVDDPAAFEIAQEFGVQNFQGFLIDEMNAKTEAAFETFEVASDDEPLAPLPLM